MSDSRTFGLDGVGTTPGVADIRVSPDDIQRFVRDSAAMLFMGKRLNALNGQIARRYTL
ncbi:hypothetical protein HBA55_17940 [Pseudomaricurvus alkylphenolicus]|uniref:hypothetical protein n=1 Tax=Pseudomaricurvus alkylphenolicus TaxID=1306991 RepID=UPI00141E3B3D|nr:hypothetical protein [Pseudomaricurvus alkylphenolicus]NIB41489.1 hypothetical protein [Pseudomaricurvus alkylphenolicus]